MGKIAFVFPGQGAQHPGMGKDLYESCAAVRDLYDRCEAIRAGTLQQMFDGDAETLRQTENTQPCLFLADLAPAWMLREAGVMPEAVAGFSLGEMPALAFAGAASAEAMFSLTVKRAQLMADAARKHPASMAAVVKLENAVVEDICRTFSEIYPVNYNCCGQLVVSGKAEEMPAFASRVKEHGGMVLPLKVSGGFHAPFMDEAADAFAEQLSAVRFSTPAMPVYANRTGMPYPAEILPILREQMNHPVLWEKTIRHMAASGIDTFIETGTGNVLTKLITKILPEAIVYTAETAKECAEIAKEVNAHA